MSKVTLKFRSDQTFTIVQFTDLHMHDGHPNCLKTLGLMADVLDAEQPDFVVLTGDMLSGACANSVESFTWIAEVMEQRRLPWAAVFGNHDDEASHSRAELMAFQQQFDHCLSEPGPDHLPGVGNYVLTVQSSSATEPAAVMYMFDSLRDAPDRVGGYAWIQPEQIEWYRQRAKSLGQHEPTRLPALAFFHIPLPEYDLAWEQGRVQGNKHEKVCAPKVNSGLFASFLDIGDVLGTFVGHDHVNDFDATMFGIRLCYGRAGGFGTYGKEGFARGARLIRLTEGEFAFETWLRLEDGNVIHRT